MSFAPITNPNGDLHRRQIAEAANSALRGESNNTGTLTVPAGNTIYTLYDSRLGVGKVLFLSPRNGMAAMSKWYVPEAMNGSADIYFYEPQPDDAEFSYAIIGQGNTRGI